ncbi:MAG: hypothetical protein WA892_04895 [Ornithinimicrobium sp.]
MRDSFGIVLTLLAALVTAKEGEYPVALLFLCGTAMFVVQGVGRRLRRAASIVRGAHEVITAPDAPPPHGGRRRQARHHSTVVSAGVEADER